MLVMTTIFMTVMQMLPSTAYVKMVDIFLIVGQLYPFSEVVLLTIMEYNREGYGNGEEGLATGSEKYAVSDSTAAGPEEKPVTGCVKEASKISLKDGESTEDKLYWLKVTGRETMKPIYI